MADGADCAAPGFGQGRQSRRAPRTKAVAKELGGVPENLFRGLLGQC
jgi:hypothetical protein